MSLFKFIHIADLHLDAAFTGMKSNAELVKDLHGASFTALERVVELAAKEKPDCVLFAGDVWNHEDVSLKARIALRQACLKFKEMKIPVFIAHGNHDPLDHDFKTVKLPDNVTTFSEEVETFKVEAQNGTAYIHGISHAHVKETRNLALMFPKISEEEKKAAFHINILHTSLTGSEGKEIYAPCSLEDLTEKNPHYWALGHSHTFNVLQENPYVVYTGSLQGLHINEDNEHGCVLVTCIQNEQDTSIHTEFISLAPIVWKSTVFEIEDSEDLCDMPALETALIEHLQTIKEALPSTVSHCILRLTLTGRTELDKNLRNKNEFDEFISLLNEDLRHTQPRIILKDILLRTKTFIDKEEYKHRNDFLSAVLLEAELWEEKESKEHIEKIYEELSMTKAFKKQLPLEELLHDNYTYNSLLEDAQNICITHLEQ